MDSSDGLTNQRSRSKGSSSVDEEVQKLLRKSPANSTDLISKLRQKMNDETLINKIQRAYVEKHSSLLKKARKFAKLIREKYGDRNYPFHILLEKAYVFKVKHGLSNEEFGEFQRIYEQELVGLKSPDVYSYANNMIKLLGAPSTSGLGQVADSDLKYIQEIIKLHASTRLLHSQVFLQSIQYQDTSFIALTGTYDNNTHNPMDYVHPVIAALFIPKVPSIEESLVLANMGNIVKTRYNNEPFTNLPDTKLYFDLINDPNDVVCDTRSPVADLFNRFTVQTQLWTSVLSIRNGQYYGPGFRDFINGVDMCKLNKYDSPDLVYGRYDGTVIKRLLSVFSFRPTLVACTPVLNNAFSTNPYQQNIRPVVSSIPMINLHLLKAGSVSRQVNLKDAVTQHQLMIENGNWVTKHTSIIFSNDVIFFYVDRRSAKVNLNDLRPYNMAKLPVAISGFERINTDPVDFDEVIQIRSTQYRLRSVVLAEVNTTTEKQENIVVGSSTMIASLSDSVGTTRYFHYNPMDVITDGKTLDNDTTHRARPVSLLPYQAVAGGEVDEDKCFQYMGRTRGIIFMYQAPKDETDKNNYYDL